MSLLRRKSSFPLQRASLRRSQPSASGAAPRESAAWYKLVAGAIGVVGALVVGIVGYHAGQGTLAPAATRAAHAVAQDRVQITLSATPEVVAEGERVKVTTKLTGALVMLPAGTVEVSCGSDGTLEPFGSMQIPIAAKSEVPALLPEVTCRAVRAGRARVTAHVDMPMAFDIQSTTVEVTAGTKWRQPTVDNLGGQWAFSMGGNIGRLFLLHHGATVSGDYLTDDGRTGSVLGIVDGGKFLARLADRRGFEAYEVDAAVHVSGTSMELVGDGTRLVPSAGGWKPSSAPAVRFGAATGGPGERAPAPAPPTVSPPIASSRP
jgi:hypothetical protein